MSKTKGGASADGAVFSYLQFGGTSSAAWISRRRNPGAGYRHGGSTVAPTHP